jgi:hypothetical protein
MKKGLMGLVASAAVCSMAFASPTANEPSFTGLNSTEHAALFGEGSTTQVVTLDGAEMKATEGEFGFKLFGFSFKFFENHTIEVFRGGKSKWYIDKIPLYGNRGSYSYSQQQN